MYTLKNESMVVLGKFELFGKAQEAGLKYIQTSIAGGMDYATISILDTNEDVLQMLEFEEYLNEDEILVTSVDSFTLPLK